MYWGFGVCGRQCRVLKWYGCNTFPGQWWKYWRCSTFAIVNKRKLDKCLANTAILDHLKIILPKANYAPINLLIDLMELMYVISTINIFEKLFAHMVTSTLILF